jgi:LysR family transcriptional regulator, low CO2-responsive transcriptional regulator
VELVERDKLLDAMVLRTVDLGLDWEPIVRQEMVAETLLDEPWVIVAAPHHPLAAQTLVTREQFAATPFLGLRLGPHSTAFGEQALRNAGLRPNLVMRLPFQDAIKRLVETGRGIALMARIAAEREIASGHLTALNVEGFAFKLPLLLLRPHGGAPSPAVEKFDRFLRQHRRIRAAPTGAPRLRRALTAR